jgi:hypothetical protein
MIREDIEATQASVQSLEAAATTKLERDKRVHHSARALAIAAEKRRELRATHSEERDAELLGFERASNAAWQREESEQLEKVAKSAATEFYTQRKALKLEQSMMRPQKSKGRTIQIGAEVIAKQAHETNRLKSRIDRVYKQATNMRNSLSESKLLGESRGESIAKLEQELSDAQATKRMLVKDAQTQLKQQQREENESTKELLVGMREQQHTDKELEKKLWRQKSEDQATQNKEHAQIANMEAATERMSRDAKHQFAEFSDILESSHNTKQQADAKLSDLEARMTALKVSRSLRLEGELL